MAADLASRGLAVWNVEYRRLDCGGDWPAPLEDVVAAATALPQAIDPERIALAGHSAGGHLALLAANRVRVRGVLAQAPVCDLPLAARLGACSGAVERLLEQGAPSPIDEPPAGDVLLVHGDADRHVSVELSRSYARGGHAVYVELVGCGHMEHLDPASDAGRLAGNWLERLLG
jgi:acetyl esterase/lipase